MSIYFSAHSANLLAREERGFPRKVRLGRRLGRSESGQSPAAENPPGRRCASHREQVGFGMRQFVSTLTSYAFFSFSHCRTLLLARTNKKGLRALAPGEWHQRGHLSGNAVRRLSQWRQGFVPGRFGRAADAREEWPMVSDW